MEEWTDNGVILNARPHGESGVVATLLTEVNGRFAGFVYGGASSSKRSMLEPGTFVKAHWQARDSDMLGRFDMEEERSSSAVILHDPLKLQVLLSACSLCQEALPEREAHPAIFYGLQGLLSGLAEETWAVSYILWEIAFLKEMGFGIDLSKCAAGGDAATLAYISPKSGRAVSTAAAEPYKEKLLPLPDFLKPGGQNFDEPEILSGLEMTAYFLEHWLFAHHSRGMPEARLKLQERFQLRIQQ